MKTAIPKIRRLTNAAIRTKALSIFSLLSLAALILSVPRFSEAQTGAPISGQYVTPTGTPAYNAQVFICTYNSSGIPCYPQVAVYNNPGLTGSPVTQPLATDQFGNLSNYWVVKGTTVLVQVKINATVTYSYFYAAGGSGGTGSGCMAEGSLGVMQESTGSGECQPANAIEAVNFATPTDDFTFGNSYSTTVSSYTCDGTNCTATASNNFTAGQVVVIGDGFTDSCMTDTGAVTLTSATATQFIFTEAQTSCTGSLGPSAGGTVFNNFAGLQWNAGSTFNSHGIELLALPPGDPAAGERAAEGQINLKAESSVDIWANSEGGVVICTDPLLNLGTECSTDTSPIAIYSGDSSTYQSESTVNINSINQYIQMHAGSGIFQSAHHGWTAEDISSVGAEIDTTGGPLELSMTGGSISADSDSGISLEDSGSTGIAIDSASGPIALGGSSYSFAGLASVPCLGTDSGGHLISNPGCTGGGSFTYPSGTGIVTVAGSTAWGTTLTLPLAVADGGSGSASPGLVAGTNVTITGSWPNQTINSTGSGSGFTPGLDLSGSSTSQEVIGILGHTLPSLTTGFLNWTGTAWAFSASTGIPYPLGSGIPCVSSGTSWCTTYNASAPIPANYLSAISLTSGVTGILPIANGGTSTATPGLSAGAGIVISGSWPNQTITATSGLSAGAGIAISGSWPNQTITNTGGGGGGMIWPAAPGIPCYSGSSSWCASFGVSNTIPANYVSILNQNSTGNSGTATALQSAPTICSAGNAPKGILANGNATGCAPIGGSPLYSSLLSPISNLALTMIGYTTTLTYNSGAGSADLFKLINNSTTDTGILFHVVAASSTETIAQFDNGTTGCKITAAQGLTCFGSTQHGFTVGAGTAVPGAAATVVYASDATNGYAEVNENNTGLSRVCTAANAGSVSGCQGAAFSALTSGTNTTAAMVVGTGASIAVSGSGTNAATSVGGITVTGTPSTGQVLTATSASAADWAAAGGGNYVNLCAVVSLSTGATCSGGLITITSGTASVTISSIPGTYVDLQIKGTWVDTSSGSDLNVEFNGDTSNDYSWGQSYGGQTSGNNSGGGVAFLRISAVGGTGYTSTSDTTISAYSAAIEHSVTSKGSLLYSSGSVTEQYSGSWVPGTTAAITSIKLYPNAGNFGTSYFTIYGTN